MCICVTAGWWITRAKIGSHLPKYMNGEIITCTIILLLKDDQIHYLYCLRSFHPSSLLRSSSFYRPVVRTVSLAILKLRRINVLEGVSTMSMG